MESIVSPTTRNVPSTQQVNTTSSGKVGVVKHVKVYIRDEVYECDVKTIDWGRVDESTIRMFLPCSFPVEKRGTSQCVWIGGFSHDRTVLSLSYYEPGDHVLRGTILPLDFEEQTCSFVMSDRVHTHLFIQAELPTNEDGLMNRINRDPLMDFDMVSDPLDEVQDGLDEVFSLSPSLPPMDDLRRLPSTTPDTSVGTTTRPLFIHKEYALTYDVNGRRRHTLTSDILAFVKDFEGTSLSLVQAVDLYLEACNSFMAWDKGRMSPVTREELINYLQSRMCM